MRWDWEDEKVITRIRIGYIALNGNLHWTKKHPNGLCVHYGISETVEHEL